MSLTVDPVHGIGEAGVRKLRHDLLNPLNVLFGMTTMLLDTELTETQKKAVQACRNATQKLLDIAQDLEAYQQRQSGIDGPTQLADLCSIAAARLDKPFDRESLLTVIKALAPMPAPRILLVDDAPDIELLVRAYLKDTRCTVDIVADGERAVSQASSQPYDLVLMDIDLPGLDGATAAHAIRATDLARGARPTPVVAMSAVATDLHSSVPEINHDIVVLDDADTAPLVPGFLANRREDVDGMRALIEAGDFGRVQALGHRMKGTGKSYGFAEISRIGAGIELAAHQNDAVTLERLVNDLDAYLTRVRIQTRL
jgi:CheY-like chemotaxis protein/HPt (histidine-containing phosphotransfer) domain-containing protein